MASRLSHNPEVEVNALLECLDRYIRDLDRKNIPRLVVPKNEPDLEIDELAQNIRIKLWITLQKRDIQHPEAYIRCIIHHEFIEMMRRNRSLYSLPDVVNEQEDDLEAIKIILNTDQGTNRVQYLPTHQKLAMICLPKSQVIDYAQRTNTFQIHIVNIETQRKKELQKIFVRKRSPGL